MQAPKFKLNFLSKLSLGKLADRILGEKPPSAQEISALIAQSLQKSGAAPQNIGAAAGADYKTMLDDIKKEVQRDVNTRLAAFDTKAADLERNIKEAKEISLQNKEKLEAIEKNMKKFLSLYELVTNQVNPFIDNNAMVRHSHSDSGEKHEAVHGAHSAPVKENKETVHVGEQPKDLVKIAAEEKKMVGVVAAQGGYAETVHGVNIIPENEKDGRHMIDIREINPPERKLVSIGEEIELHPKREEFEINPIEAEEKRMVRVEAASEYKHRDIGETLKNLLPLRSIKNDLCSLVTTLNWLRYLTEKAGPKGACEILKSYTTLGWITPEVYTILVKYITGMGGTPIEGQKMPEKKYVPTVDDHMKSLFFISKLKGIDLEKEEYDKIVKKLTVLEDDLNGS